MKKTARKAILSVVSIMMLILIISANVFAATPQAELSKKEKIIVFPFIDSRFSGSGIGRAVADTIITELINMKRFEVADRLNIEKIMNEQKLGLSGMMDEKNAVEVGNLLGAKLSIVGDVTGYSVGKKDNGGADGSITVDIKIVNVETSKIEKATTLSVNASEAPSASKSSNILMEEARKKLLKGVSNKFFNTMRDYFKLKTYIMTVNGSKVTMRMGRDMGIKPNFRFDAVVTGEEVKDPISGELLEIKQKPIAHIWTTKVDEKISYGKVISKSGVLTPGLQLVEVPTLNIYTSITAGIYPFVQNAVSGNSIYNDGYDDYNITGDFNKLTSAAVLGLVSGKQFYWGEVEGEVDILLASPIAGLKFTVGGAYKLLRIGKLDLELGARVGGVGALSNVGTVGYGNNTWADFMYAPDGTHVPYGADLSVVAVSIGGEGLARLSFNMSKSFSFNVTAGYAYFFDAPWSLSASWTDSGESKSAALDTDQITTNKPDPLQVQGIIIRAGFGWSF